MCLITKKLPEILKEDLIVYKLLRDDLTSIFQCYPYTLGVTYGKQTLIANIEIEYFFANNAANEYYSAKNDPDYVRQNLEQFNLFGYSKGYHFYVSKEKAIRCMYLHYILVECIVPRGSTIVYDSTELGVASQIKIIKILSNENTYQK